jgi:environmental stress-induced protein Ves
MKPPVRSTIIRAHDSAPVPWKNGLGMTREIAVQPSVDSDAFLWRVSIAEVNSTAPFSSFPDIDRHIVLLDGAGFTMMLNDEYRHELTTPFMPFAFAGEAKVSVRLAYGPTRDFNLMVQRAHARGEVIVWRKPGFQPIDSTIALIYAAHGEIETADGLLEAGDAWRPSGAGMPSVVLRQDAIALAIRIEGIG